MRAPSDKAATKHSIANEPAYSQTQDVKHSVNEELAIFPQGAASGKTIIDRDFSCDNCNYNLKGQKVGTPCPNCGRLILQAPDNLDGTEDNYGQRIKQGIVDTSRAFSIFISVLAIILSGPAAVIGTFLKAKGGSLSIIVFGPAVEELMKVALIALIVEFRPYWIKQRLQILAIALASGFGFAAIENVLYLNVYIENPSEQIVIWRWTICVLLHTGCSAIAAIGLMKLWRKSITEYRRVRLPQAFPWIAAAVIVHGVYNGLAVLLEWTGLIF